MKGINSVYLKGRITSIIEDNTRKYIKFKVLSGKRKNKLIPAIIFYNNAREKAKSLSDLKEGRFVSIRGNIALLNDQISGKNEDCIIVNSYKIISYEAFSNSFEGLVTGVSNLHNNPIGNGVCCSIHIKTDSSLTFPAIAFGHVTEKLMRVKNKVNKIARGNISLNKYGRICIHVETLSSV